MRILIVNWSSRKVAGIEDYLANVIPALHSSGHQLAFVHQVDIPDTREKISLPHGTPSWNVSALGTGQVLRNMRSWNPDLIYAHGLLDPSFEADFLKLAPAIYFTHNYYGTCISGTKSFKFPTVRPCNRPFGPACLLHYFPRRCGGRNPLTMWKLFRRESRRLVNLRKYRAIVTHSNHMRDEYVRNGIPESRVHSFVYEIAKPHAAEVPSRPLGFAGSVREKRRTRKWNLLFVGRMERIKGGVAFLEALHTVADQLGPSIRVIFAGDGPQRKNWEKRARKLQALHPTLEFQFTGWLSKEALDHVYLSTDLLVVPSLWPEPFGRIGPEAGLRGIPVAAFNVGGVSDWLVNGVNGYLAPGDPPSPAGLATAIVDCLANPDIYRELQKGARIVASQFNLKHHLEALNNVFAQVTIPLNA